MGIIIWGYRTGLPQWLSSKESASNLGDAGQTYPITLGCDTCMWKTPGEGNGNPLWYFCLGNPENRGAWWVTVYEVSKESDTILPLNNHLQILMGPFYLVTYKKN